MPTKPERLASRRQANRAAQDSQPARRTQMGSRRLQERQKIADRAVRLGAIFVKLPPTQQE